MACEQDTLRNYQIVNGKRTRLSELVSQALTPDGLVCEIPASRVDLIIWWYNRERQLLGKQGIDYATPDRIPNIEDLRRLRSNGHTHSDK